MSHLKIRKVSIAFYDDTNAEDNVERENSVVIPKREIFDDQSNSVKDYADSDDESCDKQNEQGEAPEDIGYNVSEGLNYEDVTVKREVDEDIETGDILQQYRSAGDTFSTSEQQLSSDFLNTDNPIKEEISESDHESQKDVMEVGIKYENSPFDNDPTFDLLSTKYEVDEQIDRRMTDAEEIRQINQFCYGVKKPFVNYGAGIQSVHTPSQTQLSLPTSCVPPKNIVKVVGKPLLVRNGRLESRVVHSAVVGMSRKVLVVKASAIRRPVVGQTTDVQRPMVSGPLFSGAQAVQKSNTTNLNKYPTGNFPSQRSLTGGTRHTNSHLLNTMLANAAGERKQTVEVYFCKCCARAFTSRKARMTHEHAKRMEKPFKCPLCPKTFRLDNSRKIHYRTHTDERPYECPHCPKKFKTQNSLRNHQVVHTNERRYPCCFCQKLFKTKNCRKIHEITHADKVIECSFCPRTFRNDDYRKRHEMVHTNDRPYICNLCNKGFTRPATLKIHQICHSNERNIACRFCDKKFNRKEHAQRHEKIHLNDRQYPCSYCPKRFITSWKCKRHEKIHLRKMESAEEKEDV